VDGHQKAGWRNDRTRSARPRSSWTGGANRGTGPRRARRGWQLRRDLVGGADRTRWVNAVRFPTRPTRRDNAIFRVPFGKQHTQNASPFPIFMKASIIDFRYLRRRKRRGFGRPGYFPARHSDVVERHILFLSLHSLTDTPVLLGERQCPRRPESKTTGTTHFVGAKRYARAGTSRVRTFLGYLRFPTSSTIFFGPANCVLVGLGWKP